MTRLPTRRAFILNNGAALAVMPSTRALESGDEHNGFWWAEKSIHEKFGFVEGYCDAAVRAGRLIPYLMREAKLGPNAALTASLARNFDFSNVAYGQITDGLTKFYEDFRNMRIRLDESIAYVTADIRGADPEKQRENLLILRKFASEAKQGS